MTINEYIQAINDFSDRLYRFVLKSIKDVHAAEDIVQDSIVQNGTNEHDKKRFSRCTWIQKQSFRDFK